MNETPKRDKEPATEDTAQRPAATEKPADGAARPRYPELGAGHVSPDPNFVADIAGACPTMI